MLAFTRETGGETVLVAHNLGDEPAGIGPFAIAIGKHERTADIVTVEINLRAWEYAEINKKLNKLANIKNYCWDVREARGLGTFDRIIMPLPEKAWQYLDSAFAAARKGAIIHLYGIEGEGSKELEQKVKEAAEAGNIKYRIAGEQRVLPYAPHRYKVRLDIEVLR